MSILCSSQPSILAYLRGNHLLRLVFLDNPAPFCCSSSVITSINLIRQALCWLVPENGSMPSVVCPVALLQPCGDQEVSWTPVGLLSAQIEIMH